MMIDNKQEEISQKKVVNHKKFIIIGSAVLVVTGVILAIVLLCTGSSDPEVERISSFKSTEDWYSECLSEALQCGFYFEGNEQNVPVYDQRFTDDNVVFSDKIKSRTDEYIGTLNSNGQGAYFVFSDGEEKMSDYYSSFTTHQFKPNGNQIMHETFQADGLTYVNGKCVKVFFSDYQILDSSGNVVNNYVVPEGSQDTACAVFRTDIVENADEDTDCETEAAACDFYFSGFSDNVPTYDMDDTTNDAGFTDQILARDGSVIGTINSNGRATSFVLGGSDGEVAMENYIDAFTTYQFKPDGNPTGTPKIMHETFQSENDARGKCVKVYFTEWQSFSNGDVENVVSSDASSCIVFKTI